jgi:hypothetical protein
VLNLAQINNCFDGELRTPLIVVVSVTLLLSLSIYDSNGDFNLLN